MSTPAPALQSFAATWQARHRPDIGALERQRAAAMDSVMRLGLPTMSDDSWHHTSLRALAERRFAAPPTVHAEAQALSQLSWLASSAWPVLTIMNGRLLAGNAAAMPQGVTLTRMADTANLRFSDAETDRWAALNAALFTDSIVLDISGEVNTPVVLLHVIGGAADIACHPRLRINAAAASRATLIEHFVSSDAAPATIDSSAAHLLCNSVSEITLAEGARLEHYRLFGASQGVAHFSSLYIALEANSRCLQHSTVLGGSLVRADLDVQLAGRGAGFDGYFLGLGATGRHVDFRSRITHAARDTVSTQAYRSLAAKGGRVVQNTSVKVREHCAGADSRQTCRGLLLDKDAEIDTRPQLEIYSDDVKCAHGATTGRLDADMLFYMLSRGLPRRVATSLLVYAFLSDVLVNMSQPAVRHAIEAHLAAELPDSDIVREAQ
jgi:Fe-S cluster assembly protein SufD